MFFIHYLQGTPPLSLFLETWYSQSLRNACTCATGWELPHWTLNANDPTNDKKSLFTRYVAVPTSLFLLVPFVISNQPKQVGIITKLTSALRSAHTDAKIGYVGFCWGGRFAITQNALFDATVACHPSLVKFPAELDAISKPFSLAVAASDKHYDGKRADETKKILEGKGLKDVEVRVYEGVNHGWTSRANLSAEVQAKAKEEAVRQVVGWFEKYLIQSADPAAPGNLEAESISAPVF
ncbi:dienelactone hydrolase family-domain-containing protein [Dichomitus squalens]|uniref:Dienelactone hydrolase family-domain-containing protein n=1 Tax=Dichomitus squalens TaxID=114155 RepID=A0A4Q9Q2E4_9APHY|nr:dienelactone hydrolase family-domain-containing protein [Dichomitus squalens]